MAKRAWRNLPWFATTMALTPDVVELEEEATQQITAVVTTSAGRLVALPVTYASDDEEVATVDADGLITAVAEGECLITGTVDNKTTPTITDTVVVTVTAAEE